MAKRFVNVLLITLGVALACVVVFTMVLFLAPGLSVLGVKYIATGTHVVNESTLIVDKMSGGTFSGSIKLVVEDIPVQVVFSQDFTYQVKYYDNYNGLTTSKIDDPSIVYSKESDGTAVISITSFKKFVFENGNSNRYVQLFLPASIVGASRQGETSLTIISKNSSISFSDEKDDNFNPYFNNLTIETNGTVTNSTDVKANTYSLKTINSINISSDNAKSINATNYILNSTGGRIFVDRNVAGNIEATTNNARIQILSCNNFKASSGFGDVYCTDDESDITVNGKAEVTTTAGIVEIGSILGTAEKSTITTKTGNVLVKKAQDISVNTTRGFVKVISSKNLNVETSSGSVTADEATGSVKVKTKRGKVYLGSESKTLANPTVDSTFGKVFIYAASGTVKATTVKADVVLTNTNATDIDLSVGGNLTAKELMGAVDIVVDGNADLTFSSFTNATNITGNTAGTLINVKLPNNNGTTFSYNLHGSQVEIYEYNEEDSANNFRITSSTDCVSPADTIGQPLLKITSKGNVSIIYKKTA